MSKSSTHLSDRIFCTVDHNDNTAYIGELDTELRTQKVLVKLTEEELINLTKMLVGLQSSILPVPKNKDAGYYIQHIPNWRGD